MKTIHVLHFNKKNDYEKQIEKFAFLEQPNDKKFVTLRINEFE